MIVIVEPLQCIAAVQHDDWRPSEWWLTTLVVTAQCLHDVRILGSVPLKVTVVLGLAEFLDANAIAGHKFLSVLSSSRLPSPGPRSPCRAAPQSTPPGRPTPSSPASSRPLPTPSSRGSSTDLFAFKKSFGLADRKPETKDEITYVEQLVDPASVKRSWPQPSLPLQPSWQGMMMKAWRIKETRNEQVLCRLQTMPFVHTYEMKYNVIHIWTQCWSQLSYFWSSLRPSFSAPR